MKKKTWRDLNRLYLRQRTDAAANGVAELANYDALAGDKRREATMTPADFRIESAKGIAGPLLPAPARPSILSIRLRQRW